MRLVKILLPLLTLLVLAGGCTTITNLTASRQERNATGLYSVEAQWDTREQAILPETLHPSVMVGLDSYPMRPTVLMNNRWETLLPIPADKSVARYRFKFDYEEAGIPARRQESKLSPEYTLQIVEPGSGKSSLPPASKADQEKAAEAIRKLK